MRKKLVGVVAAASALALTLSACQSTPTTNTTATPEFNAAIGKVYNPSDHRGGILKLGMTDDFDSVDPGDTYYGFSWNFLRLYTRSLTMFKVAPGTASNELVPDLAETLGVPTDGGKTWTYKLRAGVKFDDGTPITSKDVKYAVVRSHEKKILVNGPTYLDDYIDYEPDYVGPYTTKGKDTKAIETPDDRTIIFHLNQPFGGFDYYAMLPMTAPVPAAKDTGATYKEHVVSSGPYMFDTYESGKSFSLKRNPFWDASTDPNRKALPEGYKVTLGMNADDVDSQIADGSLDVDIAGTGVQSGILPSLLNENDPLHARADNPSAARLWYTSIIPTVKPLDNVHCRKAIEYAGDRTTYQDAYGGPVAGGDIATTVMVPQIAGYQKFDLYPAGADNKGDATKAKDELTQCGQPNGFKTTMAYRSNRPKEKAVAEGLQQSLAKVGIELTLQGYPSGDYFKLYAGLPSFVQSHGIGLATNGWGADWNDGWGFMQQIVDSRTIRASGGNYNMSVAIPDVDKLIDQVKTETDPKKREALWVQIDKRIMQDAVILPGVYAKAVTLRSKNAANIFVNDAFGQYDYLAMSVAA